MRPELKSSSDAYSVRDDTPPGREAGKLSMTDTSNDKIPAERPAGVPRKDKISSLPVQLESKYPGKTRWRIWSTEFEIDDRYVPIKVKNSRN